MGWRAVSAARSAPGSGAARSSRPTHGVSTVPGLTQLTLMWSRTWSAAMARVSERIAPLLAEYRARCGRPAVATIEQVFTIAAWPRRADARVVDQDVQAAELLGGGGDRGPDRVVVGHVGDDLHLQGIDPAWYL